MILNRNNLTAGMLAEHLPQARVGLLVRGLSEIDPGLVSEQVAQQLTHHLKQHLHVAYIGDYHVT